MTYIDGFVIPVPTARNQEFIDHARAVDALLLKWGATRAWRRSRCRSTASA